MLEGVRELDLHRSPDDTEACRKALLYANPAMASLENLPPDQRAVIQMVLARGRSYDDIAKMLQIDRGDVRQRALRGLDALGPSTRVPAERRASITDYLLGQLSPGQRDETREKLARSPSERAWARVVASELQSLAEDRLPEIPAAAVDGDSVPADVPEASVPAAVPAVAADPARTGSRGTRGPGGPRTIYQPSSRRGGAILLGLVAAVVIAVVVVLIVTSGGSSHKSRGTSASATNASSTPAATSTTACNPSTSTTACPIAQINLRSPTKSSTLGIAEILKKGKTTAIAIVAQGVPANTKHNAYAVWLANSPSDSHAVRLGFVNPGVGKNGRLQTAGGLPSNAASYKDLLVTLETKPNPPQPGTVVLQGQFSAG